MRRVTPESMVALFRVCAGRPYHWAYGDSASPLDLSGFDCSGFVQAALVHTLHWSITAGDTTAAGIAAALAPYQVPDDGGQGLVVVMRNPGASSWAHVGITWGGGKFIGANHGGSGDRGDNPKALVDISSVWGERAYFGLPDGLHGSLPDSTSWIRQAMRFYALHAATDAVHYRQLLNAWCAAYNVQP